MTAESFFAEDLFRHAATPGFAPAWRRLHMGDADGAAFFADGLADAPAAALAQLRAAIALARGDLAEAAAVLGAALAEIDDLAAIADLSFQLGVCARALGDVVAAQAAFARAARLRPDRAATWAALARAARAGGDAAAAREALDAGLARFPDDADLRNVSVAWHLAAKQYADALAEADELAARDAEAGRHPFALANRGNALLGLRRFTAADAAFAAALDAAPDLFEGIFGRAVVACETGDNAAAAAGLARALELRPGFREARLRLAEVHARRSDLEAGEAVLRALAADEPECYDAHFRLALNLREQHRNDEAEFHARRALALDPDAADLNDLLAVLELHRGAFDEALDRFAVAAAQSVPFAHRYAENRLYALHYAPDYSPADLFAAHVGFGERFDGRGDDPARRFANPPDPERRLKIGYISPDFRVHSVAFFAMGMFEHHDRAGVEVFAYSLSSTRDVLSEWIEAYTDHWRDISHLTPDEARARIAADGIDILVDLAGHTANNGLAVMHRRAAPVQASYIGYPDTTGMASIDYRIVDAITDPPDSADAFATETLVRLPRTFLAYRPEPGRAAVTAGPSATGAPFTFGTFNTAPKLNDRVFDAWAEILDGVPAARLLMKAQQFGSASARAWVTDAFAARGVSPERLALHGFSRTVGDHLALYREIDLALDTFPYNGTTTTCEAFSMGVPVLGLIGDRHCARVGASLISSLGLAEVFLADTVEDYVRRAIAWGGMRAELAALRPEVSRRLLASPLCDRAGLARALEAAYREMWRRWCAEGPRCGLGPSRFEGELACASI